MRQRREVTGGRPVHSNLLGIEGEAPGDLRISDRHGAPVTARAEEAQRLLNVIRDGGRPPELELPDSTTIAWIQAHPRLEWIWTDGYRVKPGAPAYRPKDHREESPHRETIEWIKPRQLANPGPCPPSLLQPQPVEIRITRLR